MSHRSQKDPAQMKEEELTGAEQAMKVLALGLALAMLVGLGSSLPAWMRHLLPTS